MDAEERMDISMEKRRMQQARGSMAWRLSKDSNEIGCERRLGLTRTTLTLKKGQYQISTAVQSTILEFIRLRNLCGERQ